ncbi:MAG: isoleucine--tRNA ligase [Candidatus Saccharimonadales bacterium]
MKYKKTTRRTPLEYEKSLVTYWKDNNIFETSVSQRSVNNTYVFYDGPPFITGVPHHGTLLSSIVKDAVPRFWAMKGKRVERVWGWDCHGLPAENYVEKKLGIKDKRDVQTIGLETYINTCRASMVQTGSEWEDTIDRIGRWVDFKGAYKTMDKNYMESVWWAFKQLYESNKIYEGEKVLLYCTRCATPISKSEVAMDNSYKEITDPSVYVKLKLQDSDAAILVWTTTPWTLPANSAAAINENEEYAEVLVNNEKLILAHSLIDKVLTDEKHHVMPYEILRTFKGRTLVGKQYKPLFEDHGKKAHTIYHADYVTLEEGTGIVHLAPAYGEEDYRMAQDHHIPMIQNVDENGFYTSGKWAGLPVWDNNKPIAKQLHEAGVIWKVEYFKHSYPHCHRCGTRLMYRAHPSWFMNINDQRTRMLEQNEDINWFPAHFKEGRFKNNVVSAPDWNLSRDRFWATPMPVWKGKDNHGNVVIKVIGSYDELKKLSEIELDDYHRPWIDDVTFEENGVTFTRIDKVMDCWFESGSMPFAQFHYPFENKEKFEHNFPGDFIAEYVGQVRAWFYYLHAVSIGLFGQRAFKNVIVTGVLSGNDGRKMSKSLGNYTDPNDLMDRYSADALRFLLLSSPLLNGEDFTLIDKDVADIQRKLGMLWNIYDFFVLYAEVDEWDWDGDMTDPFTKVEHPLDIWIISRLHSVIKSVDSAMQAYDIPKAVKPILEFIEDLSNWYVRRSRKRFWKSENDCDKSEAYTTLHYVLVQCAVILAPFVPFLSEELYKLLTDNVSVHLVDWPKEGEINDRVLEDMTKARSYINTGLNLRATSGIKVRQPLRSVTVPELPHEYQDIIAEELNVKEVIWSNELSTKEGLVVLNTKIDDELQTEGVLRELVRHIQNTRKQAGFNVDDRIIVSIHSSYNLIEQAINTYKETFMQETLTKKIATDKINGFESIVKINDQEVIIEVVKAE